MHPENDGSEARQTVSYNYSASVSNRPAPRHPPTSPTEVRDIAAALSVLTVALFLLNYIPDERSVWFYLGIAALAVVGGFFAHEMAHKFVARRYGCWAEFRADYRMLIIALVTAFLGFLIAAPGAVMIFGRIDRRQNGLISVAGPASGIAVAFVSTLLYLYSGVEVMGSLWYAAWNLAFFCSFLAAFNMIPFPPFDGQKILGWSVPVYILTLLAAGVLLVLAWTNAPFY